LKDDFMKFQELSSEQEKYITYEAAKRDHAGRRCPRMSDRAELLAVTAYGRRAEFDTENCKVGGLNYWRWAVFVSLAQGVDSLRGEKAD
jgi:hypothetical protein